MAFNGIVQGQPLDPLAAFRQWRDPRRNTLLALAAGISQGPGLQAGVSNALQYALQGKSADDAYNKSKLEEAQRKQTLTQTAQWAQKQFPELAGAPPDVIAQIAPAMYKAKMAGMDGSSLPSNVQEWQYFSGLSPEDQSRYLVMKRSNPYLNLGTEFAAPNPAVPGTTMGPRIPIDNAGKAFDTQFGKTQADAADTLATLESNLPNLHATVDALSTLSDTATYNIAGQARDELFKQLGLPATQGAIDRASYMAIVDNQILPLLRATFGAQFTAREGDTLRATLGDPNKSPPEKKAVLDAFIQQKEAQVRALNARLGKNAPGGNAPNGAGGNTTSTGVPWSIEGM